MSLWNIKSIFPTDNYFWFLLTDLITWHCSVLDMNTLVESIPLQAKPQPNSSLLAARLDRE